MQGMSQHGPYPMLHTIIPKNYIPIALVLLLFFVHCEGCTWDALAAEGNVRQYKPGTYNE